MIGWGHHGRSIDSGLRFPFEMLNRFGSQVADIAQQVVMRSHQQARIALTDANLGNGICCYFAMKAATQGCRPNQVRPFTSP
jgi:hypothetical protein